MADNLNDNGIFFQKPHNVNDQQLSKGNYRPVRVRAMDPDTCLFMMDSKDRISGTDYNFTVSAQKAIMNPLKAQVTRASIPKIPNINANNNTITINHAIAGVFSVTLQPGYYNQNSLINTMQNSINAVLSTLTGADNFIVNFNTMNKTISVTSKYGTKWFFVNTSSFYLYGYNVANFQGFPVGDVPSVVGAVSWYSGNCGLLYSRFVAIKSNVLSAHAYETSRTSAGLTNTIAVISLVNSYDASDFSVNNVYQGNILMDSTVEVASVLNIAQAGAQLQIVDISLNDEFGFDLGSSLNLGLVSGGNGASYNSSELGCLIWLTIFL